MITALPFWTDKNFQYFRRHYCQGKDQFSAVNCRYDRLLPWMVKNQSGAPAYIYLVQRDSQLALDITGLITTLNGTYDGEDFCFSEGATDHNGAMVVDRLTWNGSAWVASASESWNTFVTNSGYYYLEINFGGATYYSDLMKITDFPEFSDDPTGCSEPMVRIECTSACPVGEVPPLGVQKLFVTGETSDPEYSLDIEAAKDGNDVSSALWAKSKKRYSIKFYGVETVADFISTIPLYSVVNITDQTGFQTPVRDIDFKISWPEDQDGCLALIELSYAVQYINQTFCC